MKYFVIYFLFLTGCDHYDIEDTISKYKDKFEIKEVSDHDPLKKSYIGQPDLGAIINYTFHF